MSEYRCAECDHLKPSKMELMECELQEIRFLVEDKSRWTYDPTCIHDDEVRIKKLHSNYDMNHLMDRFEKKASTPASPMVTSASTREWWEVETTGWSDGTSWFSWGSLREVKRFGSPEQAIAAINRGRSDDATIKWRYVHVTSERSDNRSVVTRVWTEVK